MFTRIFLLILTTTFIFPQTIYSNSLCETFKNRHGVMAFIEETWFVASETLKGSGRQVYEAWKEERFMYEVAGERFDMLIDEGKSITQALDTLEEEGLSEYIVYYAGRVPPMKFVKLTRYLRKAGGYRFVRPGSGSHQVWGNGTTEVVIPRHSKPIGKGLLIKIFKDAGVPVPH